VASQRASDILFVTSWLRLFPRRRFGAERTMPCARLCGASASRWVHSPPSSIGGVGPTGPAIMAPSPAASNMPWKLTSWKWPAGNAKRSPVRSEWCGRKRSGVINPPPGMVTTWKRKVAVGSARRRRRAYLTSTRSHRRHPLITALAYRKRHSPIFRKFRYQKIKLPCAPKNRANQQTHLLEPGWIPSEVRIAFPLKIVER
jgi:hypothetical protein